MIGFGPSSGLLGPITSLSDEGWFGYFCQAWSCINIFYLSSSLPLSSLFSSITRKPTLLLSPSFLSFPPFFKNKIQIWVFKKEFSSLSVAWLSAMGASAVVDGVGGGGAVGLECRDGLNFFEQNLMAKTTCEHTYSP